jgi:DNA-binding SARP family transcriptional activator
MPRLSISLLGPFQVTLDGTPITDFATDKVRALLAYLAVEADRPHRREALTGLLWPDQPEAKARQNLRQALSHLRQALGDRDDATSFLLVTRETIQLNAGCDYVSGFKTS